MKSYYRKEFQPIQQDFCKLFVRIHGAFRMTIFVRMFCILWAVMPLTATESYAQQENVYQQSFDMVWDTIYRRFYDAEFNGVDWQESRKRFREDISSSSDDDSFYVAINTMLFELGVSHLGVVPMDNVTQLGEAAAFAEGSIGIEVRFVQKRLLVTGVRKGSPAERAGVRTGFEVLSLNGHSIGALTKKKKASPTPPFHERNEEYNLLGEIYWELMGAVDQSVKLRLRDHSRKLMELDIPREPRSEQAVFDEGMPPTYVSFESRWLDETTGYIRFSSFHPELLDRIERAIGEFADASGLVIDLRGNPGGAFPVRRQLARHFINERSLIWQFRGRGGIDDIYIDPVEKPYRGGLVILVDGFCASSSEEFSGGLQALGRATVIGTRTPGRDVVMDIAALPVGAYFVFPVAETITSKGRVLEYNGVLPDIEVAHDPDLLGVGRDGQLERAVLYLD